MTKAESSVRDIPIERVPETLQAYADGIGEYLCTFFKGTITSMVNHDLTGDFCIWLNLSYDNRLLIMEVGAAGVSFADIDHYRKRAAWEENHADCPPPEPLRLDYADPGMMQQIKQKVQEFECPGHQSSG